MWSLIKITNLVFGPILRSESSDLIAPDDESSSLKALDAAKDFEAHHLLVQPSVYKSTPLVKVDYMAGPKMGFQQIDPDNFEHYILIRTCHFILQNYVNQINDFGCYVSMGKPNNGNAPDALVESHSMMKKELLNVTDSEDCDVSSPGIRQFTFTSRDFWCGLRKILVTIMHVIRKRLVVVIHLPNISHFKWWVAFTRNVAIRKWPLEKWSTQKNKTKKSKLTNLFERKNRNHDYFVSYVQTNT